MSGRRIMHDAIMVTAISRPEYNRRPADVRN
jgi:hypothetical protein